MMQPIKLYTNLLGISAETAKKSRLFTNYHIIATPNAQPTTDEIGEIVECSGGKYGDKAPIKRKPNTKLVLITHKKDKKLWPIYRQIHPGIQIVGSEGFMQSVVQQKINFSQFEVKEQVERLVWDKQNKALSAMEKCLDLYSPIHQFVRYTEIDTPNCPS